MTLFCTLNCISFFYKENVPDSFLTKLENSVHSAVVTECSSGNSGSSLFKAHWPEIFHTDLVLKMSIQKWTHCVGYLNTFLETPGCTLSHGPLLWTEGYSCNTTYCGLLMAYITNATLIKLSPPNSKMSTNCMLFWVWYFLQTFRLTLIKRVVKRFQL